MNQVLQLITKLEESKLTKLHLKKGDFELTLEKSGPVQTGPCHHYFSQTVTGENATEAAFQSEIAQKGEKGGQFVRKEPEGKYVTSPMVGTFYSSSSPSHPPFVKVGDRVDENTVVCIIEAMKVMNEVKSGVSGIVAEMLTDNAEPVEFGSKLLRIK